MRPQDRREAAALGRLQDELEDVKQICWGPDIIIKMFADLDLVFFGGWLYGNVIVQRVEEAELPRAWGKTTPVGGNHDYDRVLISLNADHILGCSKPFRQMMETTLHGMVHAYEKVLVARSNIDGRLKGHGPHFQRRLVAVFENSEAMLGKRLDARNHLREIIPWLEAEARRERIEYIF